MIALILNDGSFRIFSVSRYTLWCHESVVRQLRVQIGSSKPYTKANHHLYCSPVTVVVSEVVSDRSANDSICKLGYYR